MEQLSMEEVQKISLETLKFVADICEKEKIRYCLAYGTLLGAVRHSNFIPWDDDIDIWMPRPDYERLLMYFENNKGGTYPYRMFNRKTVNNYPYMITRISDERYELDVENEKNYGMGVFIDIYVIDGLGCSLEGARDIVRKASPLSSTMFLSSRKKFVIGLTKGRKAKSLKYPLYLLSKIMGTKFWASRIDAVVRKLNWEKSEYAGCVVWGGQNLINGIFPKTYFTNLKKSPFGKYEFNIPVDYDLMLSSIYGNYMQLPPEKDRIYHHLYKAYKK